jgi:hypothetical protein
LCLALLSSGCAVLRNPFAPEPVKTVEVVTKAQERLPLNLPDPAPLDLAGSTWVIITPENAEEVWKKLQEQKSDLVLFGLTDDGYEQLAIDFAKIRNYIQQQREITNKYREYYEPKKTENSND